MPDDVVRGLEGIVAVETSICDLDGEGGRLAYRGYDVPDMARRGVTYEEIVYLLLNGELPDRAALKAFSAELIAERKLPGDLLRAIKLIPPATHRMAALRGAVGMLGLYDPEAEDESPEANRRKAVRLIARMPVVAAAIHRAGEGEKPLSPRKGLGHAANFLHMVFGEKPDKADVKALDTSLVLYAEHEINASTFTGRVVASTLSDIYSAVTAAIGSLKGPLHGGAGLAVMETLEEIGEAENAEPFLEKALAEKRLLMGFGHRVYYRSGDPRAAVLMGIAEETCRRRGADKWFDIARALDRGVQSRKGIIPNVDFYSAPLWRGLGLPTGLFVPIIAVSRVAGWCANILEQQGDNRLIRPRARYTGAPKRAYKSLRGRR